MDAEVSVSVGLLFSIAGFLLQVGVTGGMILLAFGQLRQQVAAVEEKLKEHSSLLKEHTGLSIAIVRLDTELESVVREIKGLREDFRRVLDEFTRIQLPGRRP